MRHFNYDLHEINVAINDEESAAKIKKKIGAEMSLKNLKRYATVSFIDWFVRRHVIRPDLNRHESPLV